MSTDMGRNSKYHRNSEATVFALVSCSMLLNKVNSPYVVIVKTQSSTGGLLHGRLRVRKHDIV